MLFLNFTLAIVPVIIISLDPPEPGLMLQPPRNPRRAIFNRSTRARWSGLGTLLGALCLFPVAFGPDRPSVDVPTASVTMGFVVMALATAFAGFVMRRSTAAGWTRPLLQPTLLTLGAVVLVVLGQPAPADRDQRLGRTDPRAHAADGYR